VRRLIVLGAAFVFALTLSHRAQAAGQTLVFRSAPVTVDPYGVAQSYQLVPSPSVDGYVTAINADVVDADGNSVPISQVMLHHIVFAKIGTPDNTCAKFRGYDGRSFPVPVQRFYGEGEERTAIQFPAGTGYPNRGSDRWGMVFMLMNHRQTSQTVWVQYTVQYVTDEALTPVKPYWFDVRNCRADPIFSVPGTGKMFSTYETSADFTMPESGTFVAGGAHLHGGGLRLQLSDETCAGANLFTSEPTWGLPLIKPVMHEPGPKHMTTFSTTEGIPISAGDRVRLSATYDDSLPHVRVMGIMLLYLVPGQVSQCQAVPALPPDPASQPSAPPRIRLPLLVQPPATIGSAPTSFVGDYQFARGRVSLSRGSTFTWRFLGPSLHDVTLANGPVGFASPSVTAGRFRFRFTVPGTYRLFCSLHPALMTQVIVVR
jgi:hypothetical protein